MGLYSSKQEVSQFEIEKCIFKVDIVVECVSLWVLIKYLLNEQINT